ncbi:efflux RND transporter permease subunit [Rubeoparvulum massiliense]|uniref:efflux RND transporter permease subunit n=1 Tax=Rubeoparvulum massiliense TaxID=1631346 RepID=UPI00065E7B82|nr:efflux RND transporter permease subunit [Rubeoparvulum massiliense]
MKLIDVSVRRPVGVTMLVFAIIILGFVSFTNLVVDLFPEINPPIAVIVTSYPGVAPQEVEKLVTNPIEDVLGTLQGLKRIRSSTSTGTSLVIPEFDWGSDMDQKMLDIREKLDQVRDFLPEDAEKPKVLKFDPNAMPIIQLGLTGDMNLQQLSTIADDIVKPELERAEGVASVGLEGQETDEILVEVNPDRLLQYQLSLNQIAQAIASENIQVSAGTLDKGERNLQIRLDGSITNVEQIRNLYLALNNGGTLKLSEIATIQQVPKKATSLARLNGDGSLIISVTKESDANTVSTSDNVLKAMSQIEKRLPQGVKLEIINDMSIFIRQSIDSVKSNIIAGGAISMLILLLFLKRLGPTLVIGISMPISVIATFAMVYFFGQTLNLLTLGGLALGIGMMVDSSIVILENIFKYRERGASKIEAATAGASEVASAVIASALTTIAVFIPIVFVQGLASVIFTPLALTVTFSLLASLFAALTLVPAIAARLVTGTDIKEEKKDRWYNRILIWFNVKMDGIGLKYRSLLDWALIHRKRVVLFTIAMIIASFFLVPFIGTEFIPSADQGEIQVSLTLPNGTQLGVTNETISQVEEKLLQMPEVALIATSVGGGNDFGISSTSSSQGSLYVKLVPPSERKKTTMTVIEEIRQFEQELPGVKMSVVDLESGGFGGTSPIAIMLKGNDLMVLEDLANQLKAEVAQVEGTRNVKHSLEAGFPQLEVIVNRAVAAQYGLSYGSISSTVKAAFGGQIGTRIKVDGQELDVRISYPESYRHEMKNVGNLLIPTPTGSFIPLSSVAEVKETLGPNSINHDDKLRTVEVVSDITGRDLGSVNQDIQKRLENFSLPSGYYISTGGEVQEMTDAFGQLALALLLSILLVYIVMAVQFESLLSPFIIMFSLPATIVGVFLGLAVTGRALSVVAFIGLIILAGIVVNNAIVLVDYINILRSRGMERDAAIKEAGPSRLRPILMTTLTTVLGMLPLAIGIGEGAEIQAPLATVVVFGLTFSTLVTLVFVPVIYSIFDDAEKRMLLFFSKDGRGQLKELRRLKKEERRARKELKHQKKQLKSEDISK